MRIISQDNVKDFPYEMCIIWVIENKIFASPIGEPDTEAVMAEYSTQEKAEKLCRNSIRRMLQSHCLYAKTYHLMKELRQEK